MDLHPQVVHFPIALLFTAGAFYLWALRENTGFSVQAGKVLHILGLVGVGAAMITGTLAEGNLIQTEAIHDRVQTHEQLSYAVLWVFALMLAWLWLREKVWKVTERWAFAISFGLLLSLVVLTGWNGGQLVYKLGAGVEPMRKHLIEERDRSQAPLPPEERAKPYELESQENDED